MARTKKQVGFRKDKDGSWRGPWMTADEMFRWHLAGNLPMSKVLSSMFATQIAATPRRRRGKVLKEILLPLLARYLEAFNCKVIVKKNGVKLQFKP